nr:serine hydrolase [Marinicella sp. W31]MDC2875703.1 serine hydrolase [Marinicella sp. W31]
MECWRDHFRCRGSADLWQGSWNRSGPSRQKSQADRLRSFQGPEHYGLALRCTDGWVGHTGELPGYTTVIYYNTQTDTTVAIQTNSDIPSGDCGDAEVLASNTQGISCSLPAMRIFNAVAPLLGGTVLP